MRRIFHKIKGFFKQILTVLLFAGAVAVVYYLFPRQGKFPYEYLNGSPWLHETLIAEFDFPIMKSAQEMDAERDSLLARHKPYFIFQEEVGQSKLDEFADEFSSLWHQFVQERDLENVYSPEILESLKEKYYSNSIQILDSIYRTGVLPDFAGSESVDVSMGIGVIKNRIVEDRSGGSSIGSVDSYKKVRQSLTDTEKLKPLQEDELLDLFNHLNFNHYIVSNLQFDRETTEAVKRSMLSELSSFNGMVLKSQRIISRGEVISGESFRALESLRFAYEKQTGDLTARILVRVGQLFLISICFFALFFFFRQYRKEVLQNNLKMTFVLLMLLLVVLAGSLAGSSDTISLYLVPFVILPVIMRAFLDSRVALFVHLIAMLLVGFLVPNAFEFIFIQMLAGFAGIVSLSHLHRRGQLVMTSIIVFSVYSVIYLSMSVLHNASIHGINWVNIGWFAGNSVLLLFSYPLIYIFEKIFGFISDVTLIEISDSNHPLLRKLAEEAPGTFQHTMQVANLAESAIRIIGGNPLLVRAGAMYHDIGKSDNSMLFTENQVSGVNPHDQLGRKESARLIINHVIRGVEIAKKYKLPKTVIDFIYTHHGTGKTQYFLKMFAKENPENVVDPKEFAYPGPRPYSKETAVLMMADSVEAASRSLTDFSEDSLRELINSIIDAQMKEGQFDEADLTFRDVLKTKEVFLSKLMNTYHARIQYPK